jgi:hypothetical protein
MRWFSIILLILFSTVGYSQNWEFGATAGLSNYKGDLAPSIKLAESNYTYGIFVKRNFNPFASLSLNVNQGIISGNDQNFDFLKERNLNFSSEIVEISTIFEFNFFGFAEVNGIKQRNFSPYTFIGFGFFTHEPITVLNNVEYKLRMIDTEGLAINNTDERDRSTYSKYQVCMPIGGGFKWRINDRYNMAINVGFRYTFTDYLDDVSTVYFDPEILQNKYDSETAALADRSLSGYAFNGKQRGRSDLNDWYIFSGITLSYKFKNKVCPFN